MDRLMKRWIKGTSLIKILLLLAIVGIAGMVFYIHGVYAGDLGLEVGPDEIHIENVVLGKPVAVSAG